MTLSQSSTLVSKTLAFGLCRSLTRSRVLSVALGFVHYFKIGYLVYPRFNDYFSGKARAQQSISMDVHTRAFITSKGRHWCMAPFYGAPKP